MNINLDNIKLAIFDLDGTLINSTSIWFDIDKKFFLKRGYNEVPPNYGKEIAHLGLNKASEFTVEHYFPNENPEDILKEWEEMCLDEYANNISLKPGVKEFFDILKEKNIKIALATANSKSLYEPCLKRLNIYSYFDLILDVNSCQSGKNTTEIYDKAKDYFKFKKEEIVVFEDLLEAIKTLKKANYFVVAIEENEGFVLDKKHKENIADIVIDDYRKLI